MKLLILGGGVFLGAAFLEAALARGHLLTVFNRGRSRAAWPEGIEVLSGDRGADLGRLQGRRWDAVIDTCGYVPADVRASAAALGACGCYLFVSSISVYASTVHAPLRESDALASAEGIAADARDLAFYGPQKAACEAEVLRAFGERALILRPGLIVGASDRSGRFSHWPWRTLAGGEMLVPDVPEGLPLQFIDVRDLGEWMLRLLERGERGVFNATGAGRGRARMRLGRVAAGLQSRSRGAWRGADAGAARRRRLPGGKRRPALERAAAVAAVGRCRDRRLQPGRTRTRDRRWLAHPAAARHRRRGARRRAAVTRRQAPGRQADARQRGQPDRRLDSTRRA